MRTVTDGIVLKQNKISDNRRIIVLFTRDYGKISAGTSINERGRGRNALALRPFTYAEYEIFRNRGYSNINNASVKRSFYSIGEDLDRFLIASKVIEYLNRTLEEGQKRPGTFNLTLDFLDAVSETKGNCETLYYAYLVKNLGLQGIMPELHQCVNCGKPVKEFGSPPKFSISGGGVLCGECAAEAEKEPSSLIFNPSFDIVEVLSYMSRTPLNRFARIRLKPEILEELKNILSAYHSYYLSVEI